MQKIISKFFQKIFQQMTIRQMRKFLNNLKDLDVQNESEKLQNLLRE
jgi:hypothetical protein